MGKSSRFQDDCSSLAPSSSAKRTFFSILLNPLGIRRKGCCPTTARTTAAAGRRSAPRHPQSSRWREPATSGPGSSIRSAPAANPPREDSRIRQAEPTTLLGPAAGNFLRLCMITGIWSRKITGRKVRECEAAENAAAPRERAVRTENCVTSPLALQSDNGSALSGIAGQCPDGQRMKGATMRATLERHGITASFSPPRSSNDDPFSEALFRICKHRPGRPPHGLAPLEKARAWGQGLAARDNREHRHLRRDTRPLPPRRGTGSPRKTPPRQGAGPGAGQAHALTDGDRIGLSQPGAA